MSRIELKNPAKFTEIGWKRFLTKVRKEIANNPWYSHAEDYQNLRKEWFVCGPAKAMMFLNKETDMRDYRVSILMNRTYYTIRSHENAKRTMELFYIVSGGKSHD